MTTEEKFTKQQQSMSDIDLSTLVDKKISKLCKTGGKSFTMTVPPRVDDDDMLLCELLRRFNLLTRQTK